MSTPPHWSQRELYEQKPLMTRLIHSSVRAGLRKAYGQVQLDPEKYLAHVRRAYQLPIETWQDMHRFDEAVLDYPTHRIIKASAKAAALEGLGFGFGGISTILPDMGVLSAITVRMLQKLSLIHGFEYSTDEEVLGLWLAAASAAGLDLTREYLEKQIAAHVVPLVIDRVAVKVGSEVAEKWVARALPIVSAGTGAALNYYFIRGWGRRARAHFLARRRSLREGVRFQPGLLPASAQ